MSKAILLSIRPEWVAKILNGEKTIEVRKQFPKDYRGWVYIYCTSAFPPLARFKDGKYITIDKINERTVWDLEVDKDTGNRKVVGRSKVIM